MDNQLRRRSRVAAALASLSAALFALTVALPEWIETATGLDPDAGSGALEAAISGTFLVLAAGFAFSRRDQRRLAVSRR